MHRVTQIPNNRSRAEKDLQQLLSTTTLPVSFRLQHCEGPYCLDFFFVEWKLCVEIDGPFHDKRRDDSRDESLAKIGIATFRLPFDMRPDEMLDQILYVGGRIKYKPMAEKVVFLRGYKTVILDHAAAPAQQLQPMGPRPNCLDCGGSGWKMVVCWSETNRQPEQRATRCDCKNLRPQGEFALSGEDVMSLACEIFNRKPASQVNLFADKFTGRAT